MKHGQGGFSPFHTKLIEDGTEIAHVIEITELRKAARLKSILNIEQFLEHHGVKIRGEGDRAFVRGHELMKICGPDCDPEVGLGELLTAFVVRKE